MSQTQKSSVRKQVLATATEEFFENGFAGTSMRAISALSGVSMSNIYNYFKDKNEILYAVLQPLLEAFDCLLSRYGDKEYIEANFSSIGDYQTSVVNEFMEILNNFREELRLLLFRSAGSSFENFQYTFAEKYSQANSLCITLMKRRYPHIKTDFSNIFIRSLSSFWITIMGEIITHDELTPSEIKHFLEEYLQYSTAGWETMMKQ